MTLHMCSQGGLTLEGCTTQVAYEKWGKPMYFFIVVTKSFCVAKTSLAVDAFIRIFLVVNSLCMGL